MPGPGPLILAGYGVLVTVSRSREDEFRCTVYDKIIPEANNLYDHLPKYLGMYLGMRDTRCSDTIVQSGRSSPSRRSQPMFADTCFVEDKPLHH